VLFTTDVSARGLDYPDINAVIHFGAPSSRDRYIHRLGRAGRMGGEGEGPSVGRSIMLLHDFEKSFLDRITDISVEEDTHIRLAAKFVVPDELHQPLDDQRVGQAYKAWLGYYNTFAEDIGWTSADAVQMAAQFMAALGFRRDDGKPPAIKESQVRKMRLTGVPGLNILSRSQIVEEVMKATERKSVETESDFEQSSDVASELDEDTAAAVGTEEPRQAEGNVAESATSVRVQ